VSVRECIVSYQDLDGVTAAPILLGDTACLFETSGGTLSCKSL